MRFWFKKTLFGNTLQSYRICKLGECENISLDIDINKQDDIQYIIAQVQASATSRDSAKFNYLYFYTKPHFYNSNLCVCCAYFTHSSRKCILDVALIAKIIKNAILYTKEYSKLICVKDGEICSIEEDKNILYKLSVYESNFGKLDFIEISNCQEFLDANLHNIHTLTSAPLVSDIKIEILDYWHRLKHNTYYFFKLPFGGFSAIHGVKLRNSLVIISICVAIFYPLYLHHKINILSSNMQKQDFSSHSIYELIEAREQDFLELLIKNINTKQKLDFIFDALNTDIGLNLMRILKIQQNKVQIKEFHLKQNTAILAVSASSKQDINEFLKRLTTFKVVKAQNLKYTNKLIQAEIFVEF